jgi:hypothetical protein
LLANLVGRLGCGMIFMGLGYQMDRESPIWNLGNVSAAGSLQQEPLRGKNSPIELSPNHGEA